MLIEQKNDQAKETLWSGKYIEVNKERGWEYVQRRNNGGVVAIIGITDDQEIILTEQFRLPLGASVIDLPAGLIADEVQFKGEDAKTAAERELLEECGYSGTSFKTLFKRPTSAGLTNEVVTYISAKNLEKSDLGGGVGDENITTHVIPLSKINQWLTNQERFGAYIDPKIDVALSYLIRSQIYQPHNSVPERSEIVLSRDKIKGMLIGLALGDALGSPLETLSAEEIKSQYGSVADFVPAHKNNIHQIQNGSCSDDTQLTLAVLQAIIEARGFNMNKIAAAHVSAMKQSANGWAGTTKEAVHKLERGISWEHSGETIVPNHGVGNGVVMKIAPLAAFLAICHSDDLTKLEVVRTFTKMTHANSLAVSGALCQVEAINYCLNHNSGNFDTSEFISNVLAAAEQGIDSVPLSRAPDPLIERLLLLNEAQGYSDEKIVEVCNGGSSYVAESLPQSLMFFLRQHQSFTALLDVLNAGGDTDTNASIVGALLGALHGAEIFPEYLTSKLKDLDLLTKTAEQFCELFNIE